MHRRELGFAGGSSSGIEMYTGSVNGLTETYMMPNTSPNHPITLLPHPEMDYVASEVVPEVIYDQGLYYPAANYYGYFYTGLEPQSECDGQHSVFSFDGQEFHYPALQTENYPYVYYPPSYGYPQSSYNPYNPYIPGAVMGFDSPIMGAEQYFPNPSYNLPVSSPTTYIPLLVQPNSDSVTNVPASIRNTLGSSGSKYLQSRVSTIGGATSEGSASRIPKLQSSQTVVVPSGSATQMTQVSSSNLLPNFGSNIHGWATLDRSRRSLQFNGVLKNGNWNSDILGEQNRGPRTNKAKGQWSSGISEGTQMSKADVHIAGGTIVISADQYNRDDFPVDYPDAKFYVIKSYSEDDVHKSIKYNVWSSTPNGNKKLNSAYEEAQRISSGKARKCPVFLFFSVNASGQFCGVAEMIGPVDFHKDMDFWQQDKWTGSFPVKWHIIKDVPNTSFRHIILENNEYKPVTNSRDTQVITYAPGMEVLTIFKGYRLKTSILDDFMFYEERQKIMQKEKSRFTGRNCYPYVPAFVFTNKQSDSAEQNDSSDEHAKVDVARSSVASEKLLKADGSKPDDVKSSDDEKDINLDHKGDANVENCVIEMKSLLIDAKEGGKNGVVEHETVHCDVVTVGSVPIAVNGTVESKARELDVSSEK